MGSQEGPDRSAHDPTPLVPVFIAVDREGMHLREDILWSVSETSAAKAASRFCVECSLPAAYERQVEAQIAHYVKPYREAYKAQPSTATATPSTCVLEVAAVHGQQVFRDRVQWDTAAPLGSEARYAARAAADLGLGWAWQRAIAAALRQQAVAARAPGQQAGEAPAEPARVRSAGDASDFAGFTRLEPLDAGPQVYASEVTQVDAAVKSA